MMNPRAWAVLEIALVSALLLPSVRVAAAREPLPRTRARLRRLLRSRRRPARIDAAGVGRVVSAIGRRMPGIGTCLTHALLAEALLRREGHAARLVIGVERPEHRRLAAHAWIESQGAVVVGSARDLDRFTPLAMGRDSPNPRSAGTG